MGIQRETLVFDSSRALEIQQRVQELLVSQSFSWVRYSGPYSTPEIIHAMRAQQVELVGHSLLWMVLSEGEHAYYNNPVSFRERTIVSIQQDRIVFSHPGGTEEDQCIWGRSPSQIEQDLRELFPITLDNARRLQAQVTLELPRGIDVTVSAGPSSPGHMETQIGQQGMECCVMLSLRRSSSPRPFIVSPLISLEQWQKLQAYARPAPAEHLFLPATCTKREADLIRQYSKLLLLLQNER